MSKSRPKRLEVRDDWLLRTLRLSSLLSAGVVLVIAAFVLVESLPGLALTQLTRLFTDPGWNPTAGQFNLTSMMVVTLAATAGSFFLSGCLGIGSAVFLRFYAGARTAWWGRRMIEVLAGVPSVVYGLWGLTVIVPWLARISPQGQGQSLLAGILILSLMTLPTVILAADAALGRVPASQIRAAAALGLGRRAIAWSVAIPSARKGIFVGLILQMGRAIGETMAVLMVCGNIVQMPGSLFDSVRTLTANIALEMGYAGPEHRSILFVSGLMLLAVVTLLMLIADLIGGAWTPPVQGSRKLRLATRTLRSFVRPFNLLGIVRLLPVGIRDRTSSYFSWTCFGLIVIAFAGLMFEVLAQGLSQLSWSFLVQAPADAGRAGGIGPMIVSTLLMVGICMAVSVPLGFGTAALLAEYSGRNETYARWVRRSLDVLAGVPSIVFGLFGNAFFCIALGLGYSILSGGLTLACMVLPILIRLTEQGIREVPMEYRLGAAALGLSRCTTLTRILLPAALPALLAGWVLGMGRALAETAALIFTSGYVSRWPGSIMDSGRSLSVHIYDMAMNVPGGNERAFATAAVLVSLLLVINGFTVWLVRRREHRSGNPTLSEAIAIEGLR